MLLSGTARCPGLPCPACASLTGASSGLTTDSPHASATWAGAGCRVTPCARGASVLARGGVRANRGCRRNPAVIESSDAALSGSRRRRLRGEPAAGVRAADLVAARLLPAAVAYPRGSACADRCSRCRHRPDRSRVSQSPVSRSALGRALGAPRGRARRRRGRTQASRGWARAVRAFAAAVGAAVRRGRVGGRSARASHRCVLCWTSRQLLAVRHCRVRRRPQPRFNRHQLADIAHRHHRPGRDARGTRRPGPNGLGEPSGPAASRPRVRRPSSPEQERSHP